jgi:hypothetical protein
LLEFRYQLGQICDILQVPKLKQPGIDFLSEYISVMEPLAVTLDQLQAGADPGISGGGGDDVDEEKIGRGLGAAVGPQRGPGAEPLVGVKGAKPPTKVTLFSRIIQ